MASNQQAKRKAKELFRLCQEHNLLDENRIRQVVQRVATDGDRDCLAILRHLYRLVRLDWVQRTASIESAIPLPENLQAAIEANLTRRHRSQLDTAFAHLPSLIGGMRIEVGFDVYDGSVLAGLEALEKSF